MESERNLADATLPSLLQKNPAGIARGSGGLPSLGYALWNQREKISSMRSRIEELYAAVNGPIELSRYQWAQFSAMALEFRPDLIIELGRRFGNSTCCFLEAANQLGGHESCKVISLCLSQEWFTRTVPRLKAIVPENWFLPGDIRRVNILDCDLSSELRTAKRCLVLWDAHGFDIAEWVLGKLLPEIGSKPHLVLVHDLSDLRYVSAPPDYGEDGLWKGQIAESPSFWLGHIFSRVPQAISIVDFTSRNRLPLHSADESLHRDILNDPEKIRVLKSLLGEELSSPQAHWFWFSTNEAPGKVTFPRFRALTSGTGTGFSNAPAKAQGVRSKLRVLFQAVLRSHAGRILGDIGRSRG